MEDLKGHLAGDKALKKIGNAIKDSIRNFDITFRYGGDEFSVLLPNTSDEDAFQVAERIRTATEKLMSREQPQVTLSLGLTSWPSDGMSSDEIVSASDEALYHAKRTGQNRTVIAAHMLPSLANNTKRQDPLEKETLNTIYALAATIEARDRYTYGHSRKVRSYAVALAEAVGMTSEKVAVISHAALLHDIGKIGILDGILNKPDVLNQEEWSLIKSHPQLSRTIVAHIPSLLPCLPGILHHHEKWDGTGYPDGLKGNEIPLEARILAIADSFDAMTSERPYRKSYDLEEAINEMKRCKGTHFDSHLVDAFLSIVRETVASAL